MEHVLAKAFWRPANDVRLPHGDEKASVYAATPMQHGRPSASTIALSCDKLAPCADASPKATPGANFLELYRLNPSPCET